MNDRPLDFIRDPERLEAAVVEDYFRDGTLETLLGMGILWGSIIWGFELRSPWVGVATGIGFVVLGSLFLGLWQGWVSRPRLGYVQWKPVRPGVRRLRRQLLRSLPFWIIAIPAIVFASEALPPHVASFPGQMGMMFTIFALIGIGTHRGWKYFLPLLGLSLLLMLGVRALHVNFGWAIALTGLMITSFGLFQMRRFLHDYPRLEVTDAL